MIEFNNFIELAKYFDVCSYNIEKEYYSNAWRGSFFIKDTEIIPCVNDESLKFVILNRNDSNDCNKFIMNYELNDYDWKVYVDDIEGWQNCTVLSIENNSFDIKRATVETERGTIVDRVVKYIDDEKDIKKNGCVFMIEKNYDNFEANKFYTTKNTVLLAENYRGGYFYNPLTNRVENIVYKDSGYANCIMGDLYYMQCLVKKQLKDGTSDYKFTEEGKKLLNL